MGLKAALLRWLGGPERILTHEDGAGATISGQEASQSPPPASSAQEATLEHLVSEFALLRMEWAEVLDKITAWANRQAARDRVAFRKALGDRPPQDDPEAEAGRIEAEATAAANGVQNPPTPAPGQHPKAALYQRLSRR